MSFLQNDPEMQFLLGLDTTQADSPVRPAEVVLPSRAGGERAGGAYDAADRYDRELVTWIPSSGSADEDLIPEKRTMDARVRDTMRNDAYSAAGGDIWKNNIVGAQYLCNSKPNYLALGLDQVWAEEFQKEVEAKFYLAAESGNNWLDASRVNTFTELVRLAVGVYVMTGEVLAFGDWINERDRRPFKTAVQMIDLDRLCDPPTKTVGQRIHGGIESDRRGRPLAYHIKRASDALNWFSVDQYQWERVPTFRPWGRRNILHIYEQFRPGQTRGVAKMVAALKESRITKKFRDVVLQNAVVNATYAASIESDLPSAELYQSLGASGNADAADIAEAIQEYGAGFMSAIAGYAENARNLKLDGVRIPHLYPGTKLQLRPAGKGGPLGSEFEQSLLRYISANLGVSYEQLSKDYSQTNYSSARAGMTETWKGMQANKRSVADRFANFVFTLWLEEAIANGEITSMSRRAPNFWEGLNSEAYSQCEWIGASRGQIDELKETQAAVLRIKYGLSTREYELGRLGHDWRNVFEQLEREQSVAKDRGLVFVENDNQMNASTGAARTPEAKGEKDDGSEDNADA